MVHKLLLTAEITYHECDSGMISSATTNTIAPAANAKAYGSKGWANYKKKKKKKTYSLNTATPRGKYR